MGLFIKRFIVFSTARNQSIEVSLFPCRCLFFHMEQQRIACGPTGSLGAIAPSSVVAGTSDSAWRRTDAGSEGKAEVG